MRVIYLAVLLVLVLGIVAFAMQNGEPITLRFLEWKVQYPLSLVVGAVYLIGMISGSAFVGLLRRSVHRMTERSDG